MTGRARDSEARIIYWLCIAVTTPVITATMVRRGPVGPTMTICLLIAAAGVIGVVVEWRSRPRVPRARAVAYHSGPFRLAEHRLADTVLIVEDEPALRRVVQQRFERAGLRTIEVASLAEGRHVLASEQPIAIVLDLGLPDGSGLDLLRELRSASHPPVIVMSARQREYGQIAALDAGADDYVAKPFDADDLVSRVRNAVARVRAPADASKPITIGPFEIDPHRGLLVEGLPVELTRSELRLLVALVRQPGKLLSYGELIAAVWGTQTSHQPHDVRVHVAALRRKLEPDPLRPRWITAELGAGYRFRPGPEART